MSHQEVVLRTQQRRRSVTVCRFRRYPIVENVGGRRKVVGYRDWQVEYKVVRVGTVEPETPEMREYFKDPIDAAKAKNAPIVVLQTDTHFVFWDVATEEIVFTVGYGKLADVLDKFVAAGRHTIPDLATLRAALGRLSH